LVSTGDRNAKEEFESIDPTEVLELRNELAELKKLMSEISDRLKRDSK